MAILDIQLKNETDSNNVYVSITGLALDKNNALFLLKSDGKTPFYPGQPGKDQTPVGNDCAIKMGRPGSKTTVKVPHLAGSRIYFSIGKPLRFHLNRGGNGPALVAPSINNPADPNYDTEWSFCEFTFDHSQLFCNISYVDFVAISVALELTEHNGNKQVVSGFGSKGLEQMAKDLKDQATHDKQPWGSLIYAPKGKIIRIMSPNNAILGNGKLFHGYYEPYVNDVWKKYSKDTLAIDTQNGDWGVVKGKVENGIFTFPNKGGQPYKFSKPSTADIFSCSSGPFNLPNNEYGNIGARLAAGFNRSTLLTSEKHPNMPAPKMYYRGDQVPTNHYSRICHDRNEDRLGYAFPYDDVTSEHGQDQSGKVASGAPKNFTVIIGGGSKKNDKTEL